MALNKSEGAGSVWILVHLPGAHLYIQVLGNLRTSTVVLIGGPATSHLPHTINATITVAASGTSFRIIPTLVRNPINQ